MRTYGPRSVVHLDLTAKAAPSRGGGCSPDPIQNLRPQPVPRNGDTQWRRPMTESGITGAHLAGVKACLPSWWLRGKREALKSPNLPRTGYETKGSVTSRGGENPALIHSSSNSLSLHQPRSMTWGGLLRETPAPSGRAAYDYAIGSAVARFNSRGGVEGHAGRGAGGANSPASASACQRKQVGIKLIAGFATGPRDTYSQIPEPAEDIDPRQSMTGGMMIPSMVMKQRGESEAGRMQTVGVSASAFAALLTNADPDAVRTHVNCSTCGCPATIQSSDGACGGRSSGRSPRPFLSSIDQPGRKLVQQAIRNTSSRLPEIARRTLAPVVRHAGGFSEPVWGARHRAWTARANSRPWIPATSRGARNPRTLITGSGGRLAIQGRAA